jgi:hypothetical protein
VLEEIADLLEVLDEFQKNLGINESEVEAARLKKRGKRGGFQDSVVLVKTSPFSFNEEEEEEAPGQQLEFPELGEVKRHVSRWQLRRLENGSLLISYVPPVLEDLREFDAQIRGMKVRVKYLDNGIEIMSMEDPHAEVRQEMLPGF